MRRLLTTGVTVPFPVSNISNRRFTTGIQSMMHDVKEKIVLPMSSVYSGLRVPYATTIKVRVEKIDCNNHEGRNR